MTLLLRLAASAATVCGLFSISSEAPAQAWAKEPATVFGVKLGAPLRDSGIAGCGDNYWEARVFCYRDDRVAVAVGSTLRQTISPPALPLPYVVTLSLHDEHVASLNLDFDSADFDAMVAILSERYGPAADIRRSTVTTATGATFERRIAVWLGPTVGLSVDERAGSVLRASASFTHLQIMTARRAAANRANRDAASKF